MKFVRQPTSAWSGRVLFISLQLPALAVMPFAIGIKYGLDVAVQGPQMPMRANIVGPPDAATSVCIAACHSAASCSAFGSLVM